MAKIFVLFDFIEGNPGISNLTSIYKPALVGEFLNKISVLQSWVEKKTQVIVRWPKQHTSSWNVTDYNSHQPVDTQFRAGIAIHFTDDKDELCKMRDDILKQRSVQSKAIQSTVTQQYNTISVLSPVPSCTTADPLILSTSGPAKIVRQLFPPEDGGLGRKRTKEMDTEEYEDLFNENKKLKEEVMTMGLELADKKAEIQQLQDEIVNLRAEHPTHLSESLKENLLLLNNFLTSGSPGHSSVVNRMPSTPHSNYQSSPSIVVSNSPKLVPFDGDLKIEYNAARDALAFGRDGNNKESLNAMVGSIIDYFMKTEEQANHSLSGRPCRSIKGSHSKKIFPPELVNGLINYISPRWKKWYNVDVPKGSITAAITAKLVNSHTKQLKILKKRKENSTADEDIEKEFEIEEMVPESD